MKKIILLFALSFLVGCASVTKPVSLKSNFWENKQQSIGVATTASGLPTATLTGSQGLLDYAINKGNAKSLIAHLEKLELPKLKDIPNDFATQLQSRGFNVKKIEQAIDNTKLSKFSGKSETAQFAEFDYRNLKLEGIDRLLLISVDRVGTTRNYYGFIPTGPPQADLALKGQLIDLNTNELLWYTNDISALPIAEPWEQPNFENVTTSVKTNVDQGIEKFEQSFFAGPVQ